MDINCTNNCKFQNNGKCHLMDVDIPNISRLESAVTINHAYDIAEAGCPYYQCYVVM